MPAVLDKISNMGEGRKLKNLTALAKLVNTFEPETEDLTDDELRAKTPEFKERLANGESLDDMLPEAFAVVREASRRSTASATSTCSSWVARPCTRATSPR